VHRRLTALCNAGFAIAPTQREKLDDPPFFFQFLNIQQSKHLSMNSFFARAKDPFLSALPPAVHLHNEECQGWSSNTSGSPPNGQWDTMGDSSWVRFIQCILRLHLSIIFDRPLPTRSLSPPKGQSLQPSHAPTLTKKTLISNATLPHPHPHSRHRLAPRKRLKKARQSHSKISFPRFPMTRWLRAR
jgi:hypothetical protein